MNSSHVGRADVRGHSYSDNLDGQNWPTPFLRGFSLVRTFREPETTTLQRDKFKLPDSLKVAV